MKSIEKSAYNKNLANVIYRLMRLHQPTGTWLLLFPMLWAFIALSPEYMDLILLGKFIVGCVVARSAGGIINDIVDRKIDPMVARTAIRPLAAEEISLKGALIVLAVLLSIDLAILLTLNYYTILTGLIALPMIIIYPFMKRITFFPQIFLGIVFNLGILMVSTSIHGTWNLTACVLYLSGVFWTIGYDTIYAYQDITDDLKHDIKSSAVYLKEKGIFFVRKCYNIHIVMMLTVSLLAYLDLITFLSCFAISCGILFWQIRTIDINDPLDCQKKFKSNNWVGLITTLALFLGKLDMEYVKQMLNSVF